MHIFELNDPFFLPHIGCNIRLQLQNAESVVLFGENGIGKTTLLHRFSSQLLNQSRVYVEQKPLDFFYDRKLGNLKEIFSNLKLEQFNQARFEALWELFGLKDRENRMLSHLSGGESQSLKLVMGLCKDSTFYLLDEPSQFLDENRKQILYDELELLRSQGKILILIEHERLSIPSKWRGQELVIEDNFLKTGSTWII